MRISDWSSDVCSSDLRARHRLAHLAAVGGGDERGGDAEHLGAVHSPRQFDAVDDVPPLIRTAHLEPATGALREFAEVVGLENHVIEFRSEEHTSELQSLMRISYAVLCLKKKKKQQT